MYRLPARLGGLLLLAASAGTTLLHRSTYEAASQGPAQVAELGFALATFMLASTGILLLIHGPKLFVREHNRARHRRNLSKLDMLRDAHAGTMPGVSDHEHERATALIQARRVVTAVYCDQAQGREPQKRKTRTAAKAN